VEKGNKFGVDPTKVKTFGVPVASKVVLHGLSLLLLLNKSFKQAKDISVIAPFCPQELGYGIYI
jgi:hypothetical protein